MADDPGSAPPDASPGGAGGSDTDLVLPFDVAGLNLRGRLVRLDEVARTVLERHDYPDAISWHLAEALGVTAALASASIKQDGTLTLQISGHGALRLLVADYVAPGKMRGYARFDPAELALLEQGAAPGTRFTLSQMIEDGHLVLTLDTGRDTDRYQGIVELRGESIAECVDGYFHQSEQTLGTMRSAVAAPTGTSGWRVSVLSVQVAPTAIAPPPDRPEDADERWRQASALLETVQERELLDFAAAPERLIHNLFHQPGYRAYAPGRPEFGCRCSRERVMTTLTQFPPDDLLDMTVDGRIVVNCQFCNAAYIFTQDQVLAHLEQDNAAPDPDPAPPPIPGANDDGRAPSGT